MFNACIFLNCLFFYLLIYLYLFLLIVSERPVSISTCIFFILHFSNQLCIVMFLYVSKGVDFVVSLTLSLSLYLFTIYS